jgi:CDGSH-type Zn-finger protein
VADAANGQTPEVQINVGRNGPYRITGPIRIFDYEGNELAVEGNEVFLCRCGHSNSKPFCDGTHRRVGFRGAVPESVERRGERAVQGKPLP